MEQHSQFSPSRIKQYLMCPISFYMANHPSLPPETTNEAAEEGTRRHAIMANLLTQVKQAAGFVEDLPEYLDYMAHETNDTEIINAVNALNILFKENEPDYKDLHIENRVNPTSDLDCSGTCDLWWMTPKGLVIVDFKFGYTLVSPQENPQLLMYARGALNSMNLMAISPDLPVRMAIIQPKAGNLTHVSMPVHEVLEHTEAMIEALKAINVDSEPRPSNEACRWCRGKTICYAYQKLANENAKAVFRAHNRIMDMAEPIDDETVFLWYSKADELEAYIAEVKRFVKVRLKNGPKCGYKLVRSRGIRAWRPNSEERLMEILEEYGDIDPFDTKLKTAPGLLKEYPHLKNNPEIMNLIERAEGKTISIVSEDDPRPAYQEAPFAGLEDES